MQLHVLQQQLQSIYEITVEHNVDDFLITDARVARALDTSINPRDVAEKLLVREGDSDLHVSLYIDQGVLAPLAQQNPLTSLSTDNLIQYCIAVEGVSHFLYLTWNAGYRRSVTLMELEIQAEVDKYVGLSSLLREQECHIPDGLHQWLFEKIYFDHRLDGEQLERYRSANQYAAKYCWWLEQRYVSESPEMMQELRRFYRETQGGKIRMINGYG